MLPYSITPETHTSSPDILTPEEAADYLRVNRETVYRRLRAGKLPGNKIGQQWRIRKHDLNRYLQGPLG